MAKTKPKKKKRAEYRYYSGVSKCLGCGKYRSRWPQERKENGQVFYCSDQCKREYKIKKQAERIDRTLDPFMRRAIMKRDNWTCRYCGEKAEHIDHVIPYSKGGPSTMSNLVAACVACNFKASDRLFDSFVAKREWLRDVRNIKPHAPVELMKPSKKLDWRAWVYGGMKSLKRAKT